MNSILELLSSLLTILAIILAVAIAIVFFAWVIIRHNERYRQNLRGRTAYQNARGTRHKQVLQQAAHHIDTQLKQNQTRLNELEKEKRTHEANLDAALRDRLARHLVRKHLRDVPGIGEQRYKQIQQHVFKGNLADLHKASQMLPGIGPQTQQQIDRWVHAKKADFERMLKDGFRGSKQIEADFQVHFRRIENERQRLSTLAAPWEEQRKRLQKELDWLSSVKEQHFQAVQQGKPLPTGLDLERYLHGVFPAWEPAPDWFQAALAGELVSNQKDV